MAQIINLRRARKSANRAKHEASAAANRERFGQSAASKATQKATTTLEERQWQGHKRDHRDPDAT
ncbi:MAG: DUF4169 family protein [Hyphomicrobiales bacterium]|nr:DUF4169 family protein [Hyphomicrobiales bacterium]MDE2116094.1 DUF4169 family protein [Hyphomicrobiales bacterium]